MDLQNEKILIKKAQRDKEAFSELYEDNYPKIFHYILKRTANLQAAQDITSEVFIKAFQRLWQFKFRQIPFSAWLYRIANNEICNYMKKNSYRSISLEELLEEKGIEPAIDGDPKSELMEAEAIKKQNADFYGVQAQIAKLPLKFQTLLSLKFFEKKSLKEIGQIIGKKEGTVKSSLFRGIEKLKKLVEQEKMLRELEDKKA